MRNILTTFCVCFLFLGARITMAKEPVVILIHGRDQPAGKSGEIEKNWTDALRSGLAGIGVGSLVPPSAIRFFWYADILASGQGCRFASGDGEAYRAKGLDFMQQMRDVFMSAARSLPDNASRTLISWQLNDTQRYLDNGSIACKVDSELEEVFRDAVASASVLVVVAHSMGSLVVYKNLMNSLKAVPAPVYLLTIGSMVGERAVQRTLLGSLMKYPPPVPLPVAWWRNIVNRGDLLAFKSHEAFYSDNPAKVPIDIYINTKKRDRHDAGEYLRARATAEALREAWCAGAADYIGCRNR